MAECGSALLILESLAVSQGTYIDCVTESIIVVGAILRVVDVVRFVPAIVESDRSVENSIRYLVSIACVVILYAVANIVVLGASSGVNARPGILGMILANRGMEQMLLSCIVSSFIPVISREIFRLLCRGPVLMTVLISHFHSMPAFLSFLGDPLAGRCAPL